MTVWTKLTPKGPRPPVDTGVLIRIIGAGPVYDVACYIGKNAAGEERWILADVTLDPSAITHWAMIEEPDDMKADSERLSAAIRLASAAHRTQTDKAGMPYILHPIRVMLAVGPNIDAMCVAVLHDTVEDTNVALATIRTLFGDAVANGVDAMTKRDGETYPQFIERVMTDPLAIMVKRRDILDNMKPERLALLPADQRERLMTKYIDAWYQLTGERTVNA